MASFNRVILMGNLTRDPELRYIPSGSAVSEISLAVNERVKKDGQWTDEVHFFDVTLWARTAEVANEYLSKGSSVLIEGRLKHDRWEKEGKKFSKVRIVGEKMQMLGGRSGGGGGGGGQRSGEQQGGGYQSGGQQGGQQQQQSQPHFDNSQDQFAPTQSAPPAGPPDTEIPF